MKRTLSQDKDVSSVTRVLLGLLSIPLSAFLFTAALPRLDFKILGLFCFVPILAASRSFGFLWGFHLGLISCLMSAWLMAQNIWTDIPGDTGWIFFGFALFAAMTGVLCGTFGALKKLTLPAIFGLAAMAVLIEAGMMLVLPVHLALTQYRSPYFLFLSSITGIWGVSFLLWTANFLIAKQLAEKKGRQLVASAVVLVFLLFETSIYDRLPPSAKGSEVAVMQTNSMDREELWKLHRQASQKDVSLVVWPEVSAMQVASGGDTKPLLELSSESGSKPFVAGFVDDHTPKPFNTAALFANGQEQGRYHKRKPFASESKMHEAGTKAGSAGAAGLNICYDSCFPHVIRDTARLSGVDFIALPTLDPEAPNAALAGLHAAYTPFRAAENGIGIARAETNAFSMIVNSSGQIVSEAPFGQGLVVTGNVGRSHPTLYRVLGDWFLYACGLMFLSWLAVSVREKKAQAPAPIANTPQGP